MFKLFFQCMFFSPSFNHKSKACGWNDVKCLFMCYFTCQAQKIPFIAVLTWFLFFFVKSKMATIVGDVTGLQQRHHPIKYILSCREDQRLSIEGKIISKYCNILKTLGRVSINPRPSLYHGGGMNLRLRPRVNSARKCFYDDRKTIAGYVCMGYIGL